jgi:hypothetical protein
MIISRSHGLVLSLALGAASATGAYAMISTAKLGNAETKPEVMSSRLIAKRAHKLDSWEASLRKALKSKPPALAPLNRYAAVTFVTGPGAAALSAPVAAPAKAQPAKQPARQVAEVQPKPAVVVATAARPAAKPKVAAPVAVAEPEREDRAPTPLVVAAPVAAPASAAAAAAPQEEQKKQDEEHEASAPSSTPPTTLSVEQQCRLLLRAAEGKGERAKKDAEQQCEALKQAAEKRG